MLSFFSTVSACGLLGLFGLPPFRSCSRWLHPPCPPRSMSGAPDNRGIFKTSLPMFIISLVGIPHTALDHAACISHLHLQQIEPKPVKSVRWCPCEEGLGLFSTDDSGGYSWRPGLLLLQGLGEEGSFANSDHTKSFPQAMVEGCPRASTGTVSTTGILTMVILTSKLSAEGMGNSTWACKHCY